MLFTLLKGFGTGGSLIVAIGAQNAFVLSQGVKKNHYLIIPLICTICDGLLIAVGVSGTGAMIAASKNLKTGLGIGGSLFLFFYGFNAFKSAVSGGQMRIEDTPGAYTLGKAVLSTLAVTLLNPHVYLDTMILLGGIATQFQAPGHIIFGCGAAIASFVWFFALSLGGKLLAPLFSRPATWQILDAAVGSIMWIIAVSLLFGLAD